MYKRNLRMNNSTLDRKKLMEELTPIKKEKILKEKDVFKSVPDEKVKIKKKKGRVRKF